mmetsp:Transcript_11007/g.19947  ORF Transcript_11007/g.19947 Transcript_11007/m.19947 type:complete len:226 (+) Transcript_11007:93-770(+)
MVSSNPAEGRVKQHGKGRLNRRLLASLVLGACFCSTLRSCSNGFVPQADTNIFWCSRRAAVEDGAKKLLLGVGTAVWSSQLPAGAAQQLPTPSGGADCADCVLGSGVGTVAAASAVELQIREIIESHPVVMFSKTFCPFCFKAKAAFAAEGADVKVVELDRLPFEQTQQYQQTLMQMTGARTVPRVFVRGVCIGGGDETEALQRSGALTQMLKNAPSTSQVRLVS